MRKQFLEGPRERPEAGRYMEGSCYLEERKGFGWVSLCSAFLLKFFLKKYKRDLNVSFPLTSPSADILTGLSQSVLQFLARQW